MSEPRIKLRDKVTYCSPEHETVWYGEVVSIILRKVEMFPGEFTESIYYGVRTINGETEEVHESECFLDEIEAREWLIKQYENKISNQRRIIERIKKSAENKQ